MDEPTPENAIQLAKAVIAQALADVGIGSARRRGPPSQATPEYREAFAFLTARSGTWAESRRLWCDQADVDERKLLHLCATLPEPTASYARPVSAPSKKTKTYQLGLEMKKALAEHGMDFMTCSPTKALPFLKERFRSPTGKEITVDTIYWAREAIK